MRWGTRKKRALRAVMLAVAITGPAQVCDQATAGAAVRCWHLDVGWTYDPERRSAPRRILRPAEERIPPAPTAAGAERP